MLAVVISGFGFYTYSISRSEAVLSDAIINTLMAVEQNKLVTTTGTFSFETKGDRPLKLTLKLTGQSNTEKGAVTAAADILFASETVATSADVLIADGDTLYVKVKDLKTALERASTKMPEVANVKRSAGPLITKIDNRWVLVKSTDITAGGNDNELRRCAVTLRNSTVTNSDKKQLARLFKEKRPIEAVETYATENVAGEASYHYKVNLRADRTREFLAAAFRLPSFNTLKNDCASASTLVGKNTEDQMHVELWVGKKTRQPTKFRINMNNTTAAYDFVSEFSFQPTAPDIAMPKDAIPFSDIAPEMQLLVPKNISES